jgi:anti-sigma factor RsiW
MTAKHEPFLELAAASIDFPLSFDEQRRLETHLASCASCQRAVIAMRADARAIDALPARVLPARRSSVVLAGALGQGSPTRPLRWVAIAAALALLALAALAGACLL